MSQEFVKPVIDAIASKGPVNAVVSRQLNKIDRARMELQSQMSDLSEQRRLILTLAQRFAPSERAAESKEEAIPRSETPVTPPPTSNGAKPESVAQEESKPGLSEQEKVAAREIIDKGLTATAGKLAIEQVVAEMHAQGFEMNVASPATALGSILYHRRNAYNKARAEGRLPLEPQVG
jgi:hypothetical protein